jgi:hypothetical protein
MTAIKTNCSSAAKLSSGSSIAKGKLGILIALLMFISLSRIAAQTSAVNPPKGGFKIDGKLRANVGSQAGDWVPRLNTQDFTAGEDSFVLNAAGIPKDLVTTRLKRDLYNSSSDSVFAQGSKFNDYISALHWTTSTAPDKNDINNGVFHAAGDGSGNQWVFIGGDRLAVNGTSYIDFEFLQDSVAVNANGTFTGYGPNGGRRAGDIDISMEYNNGGSAPKVVIYRWKILSGTTYGWDSAGSAAITDAYAQTNLISVDVPFEAFGSTSYQAYAFVEAAINITQLISLGSVGTNCGGLSIKTLWIKTKASSVSTAALKDFMSPISLDLNFGGVNIDQKGPVCVNGSNITLTGTPSGGTFSGLGVSGTTFNPSTAGVGRHRIIYTATVGANCERKDTMFIDVNALPSAGIIGPNPVCRNATSPFVVLTGSGGTRPYTFSYNIDGGSTLTRTTTGSFDTVKIPVPTGTAGSKTYNLTGVSDANCTNTASGSAIVTINPLPTADAGTAPAAQCYSAAGNSFNLNGSGSNGNPSWAVQNNPNSLTVQITNGTTFTPTVQVSGSSSGGSVTLRLTVTSNTSPQCGTATNDVTVTVTGQSGGPSVQYNPPACDETTFSITVSGLQQSDIVTVKDKNGATIAGLSPASPYNVPASTSSKTFTGIPAGSGYQVTLSRNGCVSAPTTCPSSGSRTLKTTEEQSNLIIEDSKPAVKAFPNPFNDRVKFVVNSPDAANGSLEIYNLLGQKVKTIYQGHINAGDQTFELTIPKKQQATLIYIFRVGSKQVTGKLLQLNN